MTKLRVATEKDATQTPNEFMVLPVMGPVELKMAPCRYGLHITLTAPIKTGLPAPLPQVLGRTVGEDYIHHRWWEKLVGISLERKTRWVLKKWKKRLAEQDRLIATMGGSFSSASPAIELIGKL